MTTFLAGCPLAQEPVFLRGHPIALGDFGLGFNFFKDVLKPAQVVGHAIGQAAGKTGLPQWANRHVIKPIADPIAKAAALAAIDVEFAGLHALINTFIPAPVSQLLHGLANVAADAIHRGIEGRPQEHAKDVIAHMLDALTFLGNARFVVEGLLYAAMEIKLSPVTITYLLGNWAAPPPGLANPKGKTLSHEAANKLGLAKGVFDTLDPKLKAILSTAAKLIADIATTGKIRKSDLSDIVGHNQVIDKIMGIFGVRDEVPANVLASAAIRQAAPVVRRELEKAAKHAIFAAATAIDPSVAEQAAHAASHEVLAVHPATQAFVAPTAPPAPPTTLPAPGNYAPYPPGL